MRRANEALVVLLSGLGWLQAAVAAEQRSPPTPAPRETLQRVVPSAPSNAPPASKTGAPAVSSGGFGALPPPPQDAPVPMKESQSVEPGELLAISATMDDALQLAAQAQALGFSVKRRTNLAGLGFVVTTFRLPKDMGVGTALLALRKALPDVWADANHRFQLMGDEARTYGQRLIGWSTAAACGAGLRIGLVDTGVATDHPQLQGRAIRLRAVLPAGVSAAGADHGTATAALLVGRDTGLLPGAQLYAANIFRSREKEADTTAEWAVLGLDWMAENRVAVVNLSLGGPRNLLIEAAVQRLLETGIAVTAAAGNGGEGAAPVFPAAQPGVTAVTAVDAKMNPYRRANRGDYIAFAAPGVDVWTATPGKEGIFVTGTSYAVPYVTAALAAAHQSNPKIAWTAILEQLQARARDLGAPGKDPVFGWGLVQAGGCVGGKGRPKR
jgi:subtilisin family serine protease